MDASEYLASDTEDETDHRTGGLTRHSYAAVNATEGDGARLMTSEHALSLVVVMMKGNSSDVAPRTREAQGMTLSR